MSRRNLIVVAVGAAVALALAVVLAVALVRLATPGPYDARAMVYLAFEDMDVEAPAGHSVPRAEQLDACLAAAEDRAVAQVVVDQLDLDLTADEVAGKVTVEREPETVLLSVTARDDAQLAALQIADVYAAAAANHLTKAASGCSTPGEKVLATVTDPAALVAD